MYIDERHRPASVIHSRECLAMERGKGSKREDVPLLSEHLLKICINGRSAIKLVCVAEDLTELVLGRLLTEGMIEGIQDIESLFICESGKKAEVRLMKETMDQSNERKMGTPLSWNPEWIFRLAEEFEADTPLHQKTKSTHSCFLSVGGTTLIRCEDIGRHNAMDKAVGHAIRRGIDLGQAIVYCSGRIPVDMAKKAIRAGIPVLVSKEAPTYEAVELAEAYGLTLICYAKHGRMRQFSGLLGQEFYGVTVHTMTNHPTD